MWREYDLAKNNYLGHTDSSPAAEDPEHSVLQILANRSFLRLGALIFEGFGRPAATSDFLKFEVRSRNPNHPEVSQHGFTFRNDKYLTPVGEECAPG